MHFSTANKFTLSMPLQLNETKISIKHTDNPNWRVADQLALNKHAWLRG